MRIEKTDRKDAPYLLALEVENTGSLAEKETVQIYVGREDPGPDEPVKALAAFRKLSLEPGERQSVSVALPARAFQTWHTDAGAFVTDAGRYRVFVGSSLEDIRRIAFWQFDHIRLPVKSGRPAENCTAENSES